MRQPYKTNWRVYLPGLVSVAVIGAIVKFSRANEDVVKFGHDFLPIYSEDGKLEGFTHPVLVEAGKKYRERQ